MNKTVVIYSPFAVWPLHFETDLELAYDHILHNDKVIILQCNGILPICEPNPNHYWETCLKCKSRFKSGIKWLGKNNIICLDLLNLNDSQNKEIGRINSASFQTVEDIRKYRIDNADIGLSALTSTVTFLHDPEPDLNTHKNILLRNVQTAAIVYYSIFNNLSTIKPDKFILYNGRYSPLRPALRAGLKLHIKTYVHERAGIKNKYSLYLNTYPHDLENQKRIIQFINSTSDIDFTEKRNIALSWYEERLKGVQQNWYSYISNQKPGKIPRDFPPDKIKIAFFINSEDEFVAFEEWKNPFYRNQNEGLERILNDLYLDKRFKFYLRIHPSLANVDNTQTKELRRIAQEFKPLIIIDPDSDISTYSLAQNCDIIISFGSTVGIEAMYLNTPSILMGRALYEDLGGVIKPAYHAELIEILKGFAANKTFPRTEDREKALVDYGFYQKSFGHPFRHTKMYNLFKVSMTKNGSEYFVKSSILIRVLWLIMKYLRSPLKFLRATRSSSTLFN